MPREEAVAVVSSLAGGRTFVKTTSIGDNSFRASKTLKDIADAASGDYMLLCLTDRPLEAGPTSLDRMLSVAEDTGADMLYAEIDRNALFTGTAAKEDRSDMNVCFVMAPGYEALQDEFLEFAKGQGMLGIKGHRSVGGFRASIYNACPVESVQALVKCMQEFESMKK